MISTNHDGVKVGIFLRKFRYDAEIHHNVKWSPFKTICTDWSVALMQAVSLGFNDMPISIYLKHVYDVVTLKDKIMPNITVIIICVPHFIKSVAKQCAQKIVKKTKGKSMFLNIVALLIDCSDLSTLDRLFEAMCVICCSESINDLVGSNP